MDSRQIGGINALSRYRVYISENRISSRIFMSVLEGICWRGWSVGCKVGKIKGKFLCLMLVFKCVGRR
jgi:hypothetical protein